MTSNRLPLIRVVLMFAALSMTIAILADNRSLAGYRTQESDGEKAHVASFSIETTDFECKSPDVLLDCNRDDDAVIFTFFIRNHSETAVNYSVRVTGIPENVLCTLQHERGLLTENGGEAEVQLVFTVEDPEDRAMVRMIRGVSAEEAVVQAETDGMN